MLKVFQSTFLLLNSFLGQLHASLVEFPLMLICLIYDFFKLFEFDFSLGDLFLLVLLFSSPLAKKGDLSEVVTVVADQK